VREVDGTVSGLCQMAGFYETGDEPLGSTAKELVLVRFRHDAADTSIHPLIEVPVVYV
jgi:hypothetical protein